MGGLSDREDIFRLSGAAKRDPKIDAWFIQGSLELQSIAHKWFVKMRQCGDDVLELMHAGRELSAAALRDLIDAAYLDIRDRLGAERTG
jgi:hypothetical protein